MIFSRSLWYLAIPILLFTAACVNHTISDTKPDDSTRKKIQIIVPDTTDNKYAQIDYYEHEYKKKLTRALCLYDLENGADSFELRFWSDAEMSARQELFILKGKGAIWHLYYYRYGINGSTSIDSMQTMTLHPQHERWQEYLTDLNPDTLWHIPSQSELKHHVRALDGWGCIIEIADQKRYKIITYYNYFH